MPKRTQAQKRADAKYKATHKLVKLCNADSTPENHDRFLAVCEALNVTQIMFILDAVDAAENQLKGD